MLAGVPNLIGFVAVSIYDTKPVHFILISLNTIKWFQKTRQVYDPETKMVFDTHFFHLNVNDTYYYNTKLVDLGDKLLNFYQVNHWMHKYNWWRSLLFWDHVLVIFND